MPHAPTQRTVPLFLLALALAPAACKTAPRSFDDAFPDATVLLTTSDPEGVRAQLLELQVPRTEAHHARLLELLRGQQRINAANLVLLARAVDMPVRSLHHANDLRWQWARPGEGDAVFLDTLLAEGLDRIGEIDRRWFGELIGLQQQRETLRRYCEHYLPQLDDGSATALQQMLAGMPGSPMVTPFVLDVVARRGQLDEARLWVALDAVSFDANRLELLRGLIDRGMVLSDAQVVRIMQSFSFDEGRGQALTLLAPRLATLPADCAQQALATFSFDSSRQHAFAELGRHEGLQFTGAQLAAMAGLCSFDTGRIECVKALAPRVTGKPSGADARALLDGFGFDSHRLEAVQIMARHWRQLQKVEREELLGAFTFDSSRSAAAALLD